MSLNSEVWLLSLSSDGRVSRCQALQTSALGDFLLQILRTAEKEIQGITSFMLLM